MSEAAPRRLHPATVLLSLLRNAPSTLIGLPAALAVISDANLWRALGIALAVALVAIALRTLAWRRFTYALTDDALVIESGVLSRNRRTIPFDRVQDVDIEQKLLARLFGLAKVSLETGGAGKDEAALDSVSRAEAERLRSVIRRRAAVAHAEAPAAADEIAVPDTPVLFAMSLPRVLLWGLFNFSLVWLAVIFGALQYVDNLLPFDIGNPQDWIAYERQAQAAGRLTLATGAMLVALFALLGVVAGIVRTVAKEYGFTLTDEGGRYRRVRGLFTRSEAVIALARVQLALIRSGLPMRLTGWATLRLQTLGASGDAGGRQEAAPFARGHEIDRLLAPLQLARPDPDSLRQVARGHVWRALIRGAGIPVLAMVAATALTPFGWLSFLALPAFVVVALLRRRFHRYGIAGSTLAVQGGVLTRAQWIVPKRNVQAISIRRSWLQRRLGTATLLPDTAGGSAISGPAVHDLRVEDAWALARALR